MTSAGLGSFNMTCLLQDTNKFGASDIIMERLFLKTFVTKRGCFCYEKVKNQGHISELFVQ